MAAINRYYYPTKYKSREQFIANGIKCVFISYQKNDREDATKIANYLQNAGVDVYIDLYDGDLKIQYESNNPKEVTKAICNGINNSSNMWVLVSPNTLLSSWVPFEIGYGYDKTELAVLCLKGIPKGKIPEYIRSAPIIRDIYDLNNMIEKFTGKNKDILIKANLMSDYTGYTNPLSNVMDSLINDTY